uniref:Uncharacterized protein n=1 Tax=Rhizophora mucronata TaxID=61149 RepID=A0A2P2Q2Q3_RHIMU
MAVFLFKDISPSSLFRRFSIFPYIFSALL